MSSHAKLLKVFQKEILMTVIHIINLSPSYALEGNTLQKVWLEKDISYDYLKIFRYRMFVYILKDERSKLDAKAKQCIFLSYGGDGEFGYQL